MKWSLNINMPYPLFLKLKLKKKNYLQNIINVI